MRAHWANCITHFDEEVKAFIADYFSRGDRRCLLVAGAGFDPRAQIVADHLASALGPRLSAVYVREERGDPAANLVARANANEARLRSLVPNARAITVSIFADDGAPVGGATLAAEFRKMRWPPDITDVVLDTSALSMGIAFPAARLLLQRCEGSPNINMHVIVASNPDLDVAIVGEPADRAIPVRGFSGDGRGLGDARIARIWLPQLAPRAAPVLEKIRSAIDHVYKTCPMLPFPAENPRRADELITEFSQQLQNDWDVSSRDLIYVSEWNPLDSYRTISMLKERYDRTVEGIYEPQLVLSPVGSKVMAIGSLMAAIDHELTVQYVETLRYEILGQALGLTETREKMVHVWLHGPVYAGYPGIALSGTGAP
ncbi:MAG TPA: hypothetical protein VIF39_01935 [Hyphomicrobium sp.]